MATQKIKIDPDSFFESYTGDAREYITQNSQDALLHYVSEEFGQSRAIDLFTLRRVQSVVVDVLSSVDTQTQEYYINLLGAKFKPRKQWQDLLKKLQNQSGARSVLIGQKELTPPKTEEVNEFSLQIREYGVGRSQGVLWRLGKNSSSELISNFTVRGLYFIATEGTTHRLIEITNIAGERQYIELSGDAKSFKTESDARLFFGKFGNYEWFGSKEDTIGLWRLILNECTPCKGIAQLGWHRDGFWVWSNGVYIPGSGFKEFSSYGTVKVGEKTYYSAVANRINEFALENRNRKKFAAHFSNTKFTDWQKQFLKVYGTNGQIGILFVILSLFRDIIQESAGMVPLLNAFGKCGTGKSVMLRSISKLFFRSPVLMNLANSTLASLDNAVHEYSNVPIAFDEYSSNITRDKVEFIKSMFDGGGRVKTVASAVEGMRYNSQSEISASVCVAGQQIPDTDAALMTRIISLEFTKAHYSEAEQDELDLLLQMEQSGLASIVHECLDLRSEVEGRFADHYTAVRRWVRKMLNEQGINTEERIISTWSTLIALYEILHPYLHFEFSREQIIALATSSIHTQVEDLHNGNEVNTFWQIFSTLVQRGEICRNIHFKELAARGPVKSDKGEVLPLEVGESLLYINMSAVYPLYVKEAKLLGEHLFSRTTIQKYLKTSEGFVTEKKSARWSGESQLKDDRGESSVLGKAWVFVLNDLALPLSFSNINKKEDTAEDIEVVAKPAPVLQEIEPLASPIEEEEEVVVFEDLPNAEDIVWDKRLKDDSPFVDPASARPALQMWEHGRVIDPYTGEKYMLQLRKESDNIWRMGVRPVDEWDEPDELTRKYLIE